jgi:hypothetical protein
VSQFRRVMNRTNRPSSRKRVRRPARAEANWSRGTYSSIDAVTNKSNSVQPVGNSFRRSTSAYANSTVISTACSLFWKHSSIRGEIKCVHRTRSEPPANERIMQAQGYNACTTAGIQNSKSGSQKWRGPEVCTKSLRIENCPNEPSVAPVPVRKYANCVGCHLLNQSSHGDIFFHGICARSCRKI